MTFFVTIVAFNRFWGVSLFSRSLYSSALRCIFQLFHICSSLNVLTSLPLLKLERSGEALLLATRKCDICSTLVVSDLINASELTANLFASFKVCGLAYLILRRITASTNASINCSFASVSRTSIGAVG